MCFRPGSEKGSPLNFGSGIVSGPESVDAGKNGSPVISAVTGSILTAAHNINEERGTKSVCVVRRTIKPEPMATHGNALHPLYRHVSPVTLAMHCQVTSRRGRKISKSVVSGSRDRGTDLRAETELGISLSVARPLNLTRTRQGDQ